MNNSSWLSPDEGFKWALEYIRLKSEMEWGSRRRHGNGSYTVRYKVRFLYNCPSYKWIILIWSAVIPFISNEYFCYCDVVVQRQHIVLYGHCGRLQGLGQNRLGVTHPRTVVMGYSGLSPPRAHGHRPEERDSIRLVSGPQEPHRSNYHRYGKLLGHTPNPPWLHP